MKYLRSCALGLLVVLASPHSLFACDEVYPGLLLCRDRGEFYKAAHAAGLTQLGSEGFERYPVGVTQSINNGSAVFTTFGEGATFFVQSFAGNHALVSRPLNTIYIGLGNVRAVGFDFVKAHPEIVRVNTLGWVLSSGFVGFVNSAPTIFGVSFDNFTCIAPSPNQACVGETVTVDNVEYAGGPASSQANPQPPVACPDPLQSGHCFAATLQPAWYDPPTTTGYRLRALEGKFASIDDFPIGFNDHFTVSGDGVAYGQFGPGQRVDFPGGATELTVTGITPAVDGSNPLAFPIKLSLDTIGAKFVMEPLAEDGTPPSATCEEPDAAWHSSDVSLHCTASDEGSGLSSGGDASFTLTTSVPAGTETADAPTGARSVCDASGNCVTVGPIGGNRVDKKGPTILLTSPVSGSYSLGAVVAAAFTCSDPGSGVSSCTGTAASGDLIDTSSAGPRTFTVVASDVAGNSSEATVTYTVATPPRIAGSGYNFPETAVYRASFSVNAGSLSTSSVQYSYSRTRMNFVSSSVTSVGVTGNTRTVQGTGTVNGAPGYTFVATATDGAPDAFGIVIRRADGTIHYSAPSLALAGGGLALQP